MTTALVLAGGGVTGIAWETGVLLGLRDEGVDLTRPDLVIGTSAGSAVGAQLLSGTDLEELYARQVAEEHGELDPQLDLEKLMGFFAEFGDFTKGIDPGSMVALGSFARDAQTVDVAARRAVIEWRLPSHTWPATPLQLTAVDTASGDLVVLTADTGVPLVDAVAASCAVPGVWPCVPLLSKLLMDGGMHSITNLQLAEGYDDVVCLIPMVTLDRHLQEAEALRSKGSQVRLIIGDAETAEAVGPNALDPSKRRVAAEAGRRQGRAAAAELR